MGGNVAEWVADDWHGDYLRAPMKGRRWSPSRSRCWQLDAGQAAGDHTGSVTVYDLMAGELRYEDYLRGLGGSLQDPDPDATSHASFGGPLRLLDAASCACDPSACSGGVLPACGNGVLDGGEACDDGNTTPGEGAAGRPARGAGP